MLTTRRGLLAPQNTFLENVIRRCDDWSFVLGNARILDYPIVYSSAGFSKLTGWTRAELLQKSALVPFMQGSQTNHEAMTTFQESVRNNCHAQVDVVVYKKTMAPFWACIRVTPVKNDKDSVVLVLVTFRDLSPFRTPLVEDFGPGTGLAAFASSADANSGWGRFARLAASLMRQRSTQNAVNEQFSEEFNVSAEKDSKQTKHRKSSTTFMEEGRRHSNDLRKDTRPRPDTDKWQSFSANVSRRTSDMTNSYCGNDADLIDVKLDKNKNDPALDGGRWSFRRLRRLFTATDNVLWPGTNPLKERGGFFGTSTKSAMLSIDIDEMSSRDLSSVHAVPRYRPEPPRPPKHVLLHYSIFRICWDWTILLLTVYTTLVVPVRLFILPEPGWIRRLQRTALSSASHSFEASHFIQENLTIVDAILDVVFITDLVLNFRTSFVGPGGEVIADSGVIRLNYFRGWFILDLLSSLPYELVKLVGIDTEQSGVSMLGYLRIARLLRLVRSARRIDQYMEHVSVLLLLMILGFFLLAHWFACVWYLIGIQDIEQGSTYGWIPRLYNDTMRPWTWNRTSLEVLRNSALVAPLGTVREKWAAYLTALYFSLSLMTTIGFGNIAAFTDAEKALSICFMMVGALVYATIFGNITTIVQQMYSTRTQYNEMMKGVKDFLKIHAVPRELGERVIDYITSSWAITKGIETAKVLNYCPKDMQADISVHMNRCVFNYHPAFRLASDGCLRSLAVHFMTLHTAPGDLVIHQGESVEQLCFIVSGSLEIIQDDEVIAILSKGEVFGNPNWRNLNPSPSAVSVRALTYCNLHTIRLDRLRIVLNFYQAFANSFTRNLDLTYNLCQRFIFRKLVDVKHELELAQRRKKEPLTSHVPPDHPIRKMVSRIRRSSLSTQDRGSHNSVSEQASSTNSLAEAASGAEEETTAVVAGQPSSNLRHGFMRKISCVPVDVVASPSDSTEQTGRNSLTSGIIGRNSIPANYDRGSLNLDTNFTDSAFHVKSKMSPWVYRAINSHGPARKWARLLAKAQQTSLHNLQEEQEEDKNSAGSSKDLGRYKSLDELSGSMETRRLVVDLSRPRNEEQTRTVHNEDLLGQLNYQLESKFCSLSGQVGSLNSRMDGMQSLLNTICSQLNSIARRNSDLSMEFRVHSPSQTCASDSTNCTEATLSSLDSPAMPFDGGGGRGGGGVGGSKPPLPRANQFLSPHDVFEGYRRRRSTSPLRISPTSMLSGTSLSMSEAMRAGGRNPPTLSPPRKNT